MRDIEHHHLYRTLGVELSHETFANITDAVLEEVKAWQTRPWPRVVSNERSESTEEEIRLSRYAHNKSPAAVKRRYFGLIRRRSLGAEAAREVGVSLSCGSLWFIDAGSVSVVQTSAISARYFTQDDRIEIADGPAAGEVVKSIATRIGKTFKRVSGDRPAQEAGRHLPGVVRAQSGPCPPPTPEAADLQT